MTKFLFTDSVRDYSRCFSLFILSTALLSSCASMRPLSDDQKTLSTLLLDARSTYDSDNYSETAKHLTRALVLAEDIAPSKISVIRKKLANVYLDWARSLYWKAKSTNKPALMAHAIRLCDMALEINPRLKRKCDTYSTKFKTDLSSMRYKNSTALEKIDPAFVERRYKVDLLRKQASVLKIAGNYMSAKDKLEEVLRLDPYNIDATRDLRRLMKLVVKAGNRRILSDKEARDAEVVWRSVAPIERKATDTSREKLNSTINLRTRLNDFNLAEIDFKDAPLESVFAMLENEIRDSVSKKFKFNYKGFKPSDKKWPLITFKAKNVPLMGALRAICNGIGLSLSCSDDAIDISP